MESQCYVVAVEQDEDAWLVSRPHWSPLRYLARDGAIRNAEMMARLHTWTTGQPTEVILRSGEGDHLVRRFD